MLLNNLIKSSAILTLTIVMSLVLGSMTYNKILEMDYYQEAQCQVNNTRTNFYKCCHLDSFVTLEQTDLTNGTVVKPCERKLIPMSEQDVLDDAYYYCLDKHNNTNTNTKAIIIKNANFTTPNNKTLTRGIGVSVRKLLCGKCSETFIQLDSLAPAPKFRVEIEEHCDFKKVRCLDKIKQRYPYNASMDCWSTSNRNPSDDDIVDVNTNNPSSYSKLFMLFLASFICLSFVFFLSMVTYFNYSQWKKQHDEDEENELYEYNYYNNKDYNTFAKV